MLNKDIRVFRKEKRMSHRCHRIEYVQDDIVAIVSKESVVFTQCSENICGMIEMGRSIRAICTYQYHQKNFMAVGFADAVEVYQLHI